MVKANFGALGQNSDTVPLNIYRKLVKVTKIFHDAKKTKINKQELREVRKFQSKIFRK